MSADTLTTQLSALSDRLHGSRDFETAAKHLLRSMFEVAAASLTAVQSNVEVLRATIHYRPEDEYRRLFCLEFEDPTRTSQPLRLPSLTAWRWISTRACP